MTSSALRKLIISVAAVAFCALGIAGGVPAMADVAASPARTSTSTGDDRLFPVELPDLIAPKAGDTLALTVRGEFSEARKAALTCRPAGGSHPAPRRACAQLGAADGKISEIPPEAGVCTAEYAPVTLVANGTWGGGERTYRRTFGNRCQAIRATGGVLFDF